MYRVTVKIAGHVYSREFNNLAEAQRFYNSVKKNNKKCWFLDLTEKPTHDKVKTVTKILTFLDKMSGH